jgi:glutamyl-tRNA synthetase/glutamyl-Q tRNA(Asp) synthetase
LLCWLDARSREAHLLLRIEDVDHTRCSDPHAEQMRAALRWLGLEWDAESVQSLRRPSHEAALDALAEQELLYPCRCSRSEIRRDARPAADGGWRYPGTCRERPLPSEGWRSSNDALRLRLPPGRLALRDESGLDLSQDPAVELGDPVLRRRDGAIAYHLAVVVDDAADGITRVVRGRDLATSTAIHRVLQRALQLPEPTTRHHFLLLAREGGKLAKLHGAVGWQELRQHMSGEEACGFLAATAGLREGPGPTTPQELLASFDWAQVRRDDQALAWRDGQLIRLGPASAAG